MNAHLSVWIISLHFSLIFIARKVFICHDMSMIGCELCVRYCKAPLCQTAGVNGIKWRSCGVWNKYYQKRDILRLTENHLNLPQSWSELRPPVDWISPDHSCLHRLASYMREIKLTELLWKYSFIRKTSSLIWAMASLRMDCRSFCSLTMTWNSSLWMMNILIDKWIPRICRQMNAYYLDGTTANQTQFEKSVIKCPLLISWLRQHNISLFAHFHSNRRCD